MKKKIIALMLATTFLFSSIAISSDATGVDTATDSAVKTGATNKILENLEENTNPNDSLVFGFNPVSDYIISMFLDTVEEVEENEKHFKKFCKENKLKDEKLFVSTDDQFIYNKDGEIKAYLPKGAIGHIINNNKVVSNKIKGYLKDKKDISRNTEDIVNKSEKQVTVKAKGFTFLYNKSGKKIKILYPKDVLIFIENVKKEGKYKVRTTDGQTGYINKKEATKEKTISGAIPFDKDLEMRKEFIDKVLPLEGEVPYVWGGKASRINGVPTIGRGLDCSGFIGYATMKFKDKYNLTYQDLTYASTIAVAHNCEAATDLKPGDFGMRLGTGTGYSDIMDNNFGSSTEAINSSKKILSNLEDIMTKKKTVKVSIPLYEEDDYEEDIEEEDSDIASIVCEVEETETEKYVYSKEQRKQAKKDYEILSQKPLYTSHIDHIGIYLGEKDGKRWFIHENGTFDNISINDYEGFVVFKKNPIFEMVS